MRFVWILDKENLHVRILNFIQMLTSELKHFSQLFTHLYLRPPVY